MGGTNLRVASWNVHCGVLRTPEGESVPTPDVARNIVSTLVEADADIVALQEVLFTDVDNGKSFVPNIAELADYPFWYAEPSSPSHLHPGRRYWMGTAILSRLPLGETCKYKTPNPVIERTLSDGAVISSHDKGFIRASCRHPSFLVNFLSGHLTPFHVFARDARDVEFGYIWKFIDSMLNTFAGIPSIICADFNTNRLETFLPLTMIGFRTAWNGPTRSTGEQHDEILLSEHWKLLRVEFRPTYSDHHIGIVDVQFRQTV